MNPRRSLLSTNYGRFVLIARMLHQYGVLIELNFRQRNRHQQVRSCQATDRVDGVIAVQPRCPVDQRLRPPKRHPPVGVDDLKYFRKTFQGVCGLSPSDYARQHGEPLKST